MATCGVGFVGGNGSAGSSSSWFQIKNRKKNSMMKNRVKVVCSSSYVMDPYKTLRVQPGASESEVKKAFRQLALQYHPDVCRGSNCGVQFNLINEAYDMVMSNLRGDSDTNQMFETTYETYDEGIDEPMRGMNDPDWDMWEEWMGWEGAGIHSTQEPIEDEQHTRVKDWIGSCHPDTVKLTDVLAHFPDISVVLTEEIMDKLVKEVALLKMGHDIYTKNNQKKFDDEFDLVKEETDGQATSFGG